MYATHDYIEEIKCQHCEAMVPYYEIFTVRGERLCEYCLDEFNAPRES